MTANKIRIFKGKVFKNNLGNLIKYISSNSSFFRKFGEVYFNHIKFKRTKGWIRHKKNSCLIQCVHGKVKFVLVDKKENKKTLTLNSKTGDILLIPPKIWFSFTSVLKDSIIVNTLEKPHNDSEIEKRSQLKKS
tara:strand:+ start:931 stop:1332 length:402 start_codon:yes stop_codon:yes gene_type:complete